MKLPTKDTLYRSWLREVACNLATSGAGGFTAAELADKMGVKVTPNLRRQIRALVAEGYLIVKPYWQERETHGNVYFTNPTGKWMLPS